MRLDELDEATLVARAQDGNPEAFELLVHRYQTPLFRYAMRTVSDRQLAEDLVQESMIAAWRKLPTLADPAKFRGWLYQITTFRCLDALRRRQREPAPTEDLDAAADRRTSAEGPEAEVEHQERLRRLTEILADLPTEQRMCWVLKESQELSYDEISVALRLPVSTVRGRLARARRQISERMSEWR